MFDAVTQQIGTPRKLLFTNMASKATMIGDCMLFELRQVFKPFIAMNIALIAMKSIYSRPFHNWDDVFAIDIVDI